MRQEELAGALADALNVIADWNVGFADVLDSLSATGLKLVADPNGDARAAYDLAMERYG